MAQHRQRSKGKKSGGHNPLPDWVSVVQQALIRAALSEALRALWRAFSGDDGPGDFPLL